MARLPTVGGDSGDWGTVLNQYLNVGHNSDGTTKKEYTVYNVKDYGALGDGTTDDTAAIQSAIDAAEAANGGIIFFPIGLFKLSDTLTIKASNIHLKGSGIGKSYPSTDGTRLIANASNNTKTMLRIRASATGTRIDNISVSNMTLTSDARMVSGSSDTSWWQRGVEFDYSNNVVFTCVRVDHFLEAGFKATDNWTQGGPDQTFFEFCQASVCRDGWEWYDYGHSTHIHGCTADFNTRHGIYSGGRASVIITDSDIEQNADVGIRYSSQGHLVVLGCTFENNGTGLDPQSLQRTHIWLGDQNTTYGIWIVGNFFYQPSMRYCVRIDKGRGIVFRGNLISGAGSFSTTSGAFVRINDTSAVTEVFLDEQESFAWDTTPNVPMVNVWSNNIPHSQYMQGWVADDVQNPLIGILPANSYILRVSVQVTEAFNSDGTDLLEVGYDADQDAVMTSLDISTTGIKSTTLGVLAGYNSTSRSIEAYYTNGGSEPTTGKAFILIEYVRVQPQVS